MATWTNLIEDALSEIGVLSPGDSVSTNEIDQAFTALKGMLAIWSEDGLLSTEQYRRRIAFENNDPPLQQQYYLTGGTTTAGRTYLVKNGLPAQITSVIYSPVAHNSPYELDRFELDFISTFHNTSPGAIRRYYYSNTYPEAELRFDQSPVNGDVITINGDEYIIGANAVKNESIDNVLPEVLREAIRLNLAIRMAASYRVEPQYQTRKAAKKSMQLLRKRNWQPERANLDTAMLGKQQREVYNYTYRR